MRPTTLDRARMKREARAPKPCAHIRLKGSHKSPSFASPAVVTCRDCGRSKTVALGRYAPANPELLAHYLRQLFTEAR